MAKAQLSQGIPAVSQETSPRKNKTYTLLIEDNEIIKIMHKSMLIKLGCQVDVASSGEEALLLISNYYDIILLDIGLPGINGFEVAARFREHKIHRKTRMLAITTHSGDNYLYSCLAIEKALSKPLSIQQLAQVIYQVDVPPGRV